jgi:hypothetical protein
VSGYDLYRALRRGGESTYTHNGKEYVLSFFGDRTCCGNGLVVLEKGSGETRRFRYGYSSEACHNFVSTLEKRRWDEPVGAWLNPERWDEPPLTDWESSRGAGLINEQKWICWDGFVSHKGGCSNHNKAKGKPKDESVQLTDEEWEVLQDLDESERVDALLELRDAQTFSELL